MKGLLAILLALVSAGCAFQFKPSIEPLIIPTLAPQPFGKAALSPEPRDLPRAATQVIPSIGQDFNPLNSLQAIGLAGLPVALLAGGLIGTLAALFFTFFPLKLPPAERICAGSAIAGILGFASLIPMDFAVAYAMAQLAATGPLGILLDVFVLLPVELVVLNLHVGFASLAYHSSNRGCEELTPRQYFLPPWGLSP